MQKCNQNCEIKIPTNEHTLISSPPGSEKFRHAASVNNIFFACK